MSGLNIIAARVRPGAISVSNSSHLLAIDASSELNPVMFPPGLCRLATKPEPTGSATAANTIGIVSVSRLRAAVTGVEFARITSGCRSTNSFANVCIISVRPGAQRTSIRRLRPSIHPQLRKPLRELGEQRLCFRIGFAVSHQHADPPLPVGLLSAYRERPRKRGTSHYSDEISPPHAITNSGSPRATARV